jgi:hypothetical protein
MHPALFHVTMQNSIKTLLVMSSFFLALGVKATPTYVNPVGEGTDPSLSLQSLINARGNTLVNVDSDQFNNGADTAWTSPSGFSPVSMVVEVAGSAAVNTFGIYNLADPSQKTEVFAGAATGGATTTIISPYATFGFYLINNALNFTWYSDRSLNGGQAHVVTYQGKGETLTLGDVGSPPAGSVVWDSNTYLMAWEDQDLNNSDLDYNDMVVLVSDIQPVPDNFTTVGLLGMAIMGLILFQKVSVIQQRKQSVKALAKGKRKF